MSQPGLHTFKDVDIPGLDGIVEIAEARKLGTDAEIKNVDFVSIMERMRRGGFETRPPTGQDHLVT